MQLKNTLIDSGLIIVLTNNFTGKYFFYTFFHSFVYQSRKNYSGNNLKLHKLHVSFQIKRYGLLSGNNRNFKNSGLVF